jgi:hypothetical protein
VPLGIRRRRIAAVVGVLGITALTLAIVRATVPRLAARVGTATLVPPDNPTVVLDREVTEEFGFRTPVLWVLEARDGSVWTPRMLQRLAALTDGVRRIPGVIALDVVGIASPNMRDLQVTEAGLEPTYLMAEVPTTPEAVATLRRRIDQDPSYAGTLVSRDGRAAMVAANFREDANLHAVGTAALALRDRYRDAETAVWVVGAPVLAALAGPAFVALTTPALVCAFAGVVVLGVVLGVRAMTSALLAVLLGAAWTVVTVALTGWMLPWALEAVVPTALLAAALGTGAGRSIQMGALLAAGALAGALVAGPPARTFWLATAAGALLGAAAGAFTRAVLRPELRPLPYPRAVRRGAAVLAAAALLGLSGARCALGLPGYGERYLPRAAAADLSAVRELLQPPLSLAVRVRGEPGFVAAPDVLRALDDAVADARTDPAVRSAMSIADVVKMVHRAFNDERPESFEIPGDRALVGRYLALAYSPAFRRFLDRGFSSTTLWVQVASERPTDLARVRARMQRALAERPLPGATMDPPVGDGAVLLVMARVARRLAGSAALAVLAAAGLMAAALRWQAGMRAVGASALAGAVAAGVLGWLGFAIDLVSAPLLAGAALAAATVCGPGVAPPRLGLALVAAGAIALVAPLPAAPLLASLLLGPGLSLLVATMHDGDAP